MLLLLFFVLEIIIKVIIEIFSADTSAKGRVLAFDNYFKTKDKATAKSIYTRLVATIYSNMENFPVKQSDKEVEWKQDDVSITVAFDGQKDSDGDYIVYIRRYNHEILK